MEIDVMFIHRLLGMVIFTEEEGRESMLEEFWYGMMDVSAGDTLLIARV